MQNFEERKKKGAFKKVKKKKIKLVIGKRKQKKYENLKSTSKLQAKRNWKTQ